MQENKGLVVSKAGDVPQLNFSQSDLEIIKNSLTSDLTAGEFAYYIRAAQLLDLNPLKKEIYAVKYEGRTVLQVGIDGYLKHAENTGKFRGFTLPMLTIKDRDDEKSELRSVPQEMYDPDQHKLVAVKIGICHVDDEQPTYVVVTAKEYAVYFRDRTTGQAKLSARWQKAPATQLIKCAKTLAIRTRFPGLGGEVYIAEELDHVAITTDERRPEPQEAEINPEDLEAGDPGDLTGHNGEPSENERRFIEESARLLQLYENLFEDTKSETDVDKVAKALKADEPHMTGEDFSGALQAHSEAMKKFKKRGR